MFFFNFNKLNAFFDDGSKKLLTLWCIVEFNELERFLVVLQKVEKKKSFTDFSAIYTSLCQAFTWEFFVTFYIFIWNWNQMKPQKI